MVTIIIYLCTKVPCNFSDSSFADETLACSQMRKRFIVVRENLIFNWRNCKNKIAKTFLEKTVRPPTPLEM